ncbi:MAG: hypothetical protein JWO32_657 [Bacteroidetes bacterium]|nr:hypothetical protein [Bacteroidota bacterium]
MKIAGFTIIRNAIKFDYPVIEAITSILPICDAFYVGVGQSDDNTRILIESLASDKIIIIDTVWDDSKREGGAVLADETNKVFDMIPEEFTWCFYIQSDECVHENDLVKIKECAQKYADDKKINGLLFNYHHFYGHYNYIGVGRRWYSKEIRIVRNNKSIRSYKDAQGFRFNDNRKLQVKNTYCYIYHYGWVKPPTAQQAKQESFHKMWHNDEWMKKNIPEVKDFDYNNIDLLGEYKNTHPQVMKQRIENAHWKFIYDRKKAKVNLKYRFLLWIEKLTGWRPGENKNYKEI